MNAESGPGLGRHIPAGVMSLYNAKAVCSVKLNYVEGKFFPLISLSVFLIRSRAESHLGSVVFLPTLILSASVHCEQRNGGQRCPRQR